MIAPLTFHLPPEAGPRPVQALFSALASFGGRAAPAVLRERAGDILGKQPRGEALTLARDLALLRQDKEGIGPTPLGAFVSESMEAVDLIHGLSYFAWTSHDPARLSRLWTYRTIVDLLWDSAPITVDAVRKKELVEDLLARAEDVFAMAEGFSAARASLGPKSIDGALRWLEGLTPAVVEQRTVRRRQRCAPLLMALALARVARAAGAEPGTDFRLASEERAVLVRACFLEAVALDAMIEWTVQSQPRRLRWGSANARYGRQVVIVDAEPFA